MRDERDVRAVTAEREDCSNEVKQKIRSKEEDNNEMLKDVSIQHGLLNYFITGPSQGKS